jgi:hypothetical protein
MQTYTRTSHAAALEVDLAICRQQVLALGQ